MKGAGLAAFTGAIAALSVACAGGAARQGATGSETSTVSPPAPASQRVFFLPDGSVTTTEPSWTEPVPVWIALASPDAEVVNTPFRTAAGTVFVQQFSSADPTHPTCRARDPGKSDWYVPKAPCLDPDFSYLYRVDAGPDDLVALHSGAEGTAAVSVARYSLTTGQSPSLATFLLEGGDIDVGFAPDGSRVDFVTPCTLTGEGSLPCDADAATHWKLYSVPLKGGPFVLRRDDLPVGTAFDSRTGRFAWPRGSAICLGDPRDAHPSCSPRRP